MLLDDVVVAGHGDKHAESADIRIGITFWGWPRREGWSSFFVNSFGVTSMNKRRE